jgi:hypothetical protein
MTSPTTENKLRSLLLSRVNRGPYLKDLKDNAVFGKFQYF